VPISFFRLVKTHVAPINGWSPFFLRTGMRDSAPVWIGLALVLAGLQAYARDPVADEFNTLAEQIQSPPSASWMQYAYSADSMPKGSDRDPVDVLLRRTAEVLAEFNQNGLLDSEAAKLTALQQESGQISVASTAERLALFRRVSDVSRRVAFANPLLKFKDILFLKRQMSRYDHMVDQYFGFQAVPGGGIFILQNAFSRMPFAKTGGLSANG
jgi:hypothetical protein